MRSFWFFFTFGLIGIAALVSGILVFVLSKISSGSEKYVADILVETTSGVIRGFRSDDDEYVQFLGVPYAVVNKSNPFGDSLPHPRLKEIYEANNDSVRCPQGDTAKGDINCLQMNIFVPRSINPSNRLPVMVSIHSGGFIFGYKSKSFFGPKFLMRHNVILVTINYRLHVYGFMCLDIPEVPGNQGLKDQVLAFRWLRENIEAFGGDFSRVTPFGISCGAHSIDFHIISENEIFFNRAIIESGGSLSATVYNDHDKKAPIKIAGRLGFNTTSIREALSYLTSINTTSVIKTSNELNIVYKPCAEKKFKNVKPYITEHWVNIALTPKVKNMTLMAGFCKHELLYKYGTLKKFNNFTIIADKLKLLFNFNDKDLSVMEHKIRNFYFDAKLSTYDLIMAATDFDSDMTYIYPLRRSIYKYLRSGVQNIFYYMFSYNGGRNIEKIVDNITIGSAVHGDEVGYLFDIKYISKRNNTADRSVINQITTLWTNFAKYRDPTPEISDLIPVKWEPIKDKPYNYYEIDHELSLKRGPNPKRMDFWDQFYEINKEYEKGFEREKEPSE